MPHRSHILALDQGTTSSRAIVFDCHGKPVASCQREFEQLYPSPGHVEHDPEAIWTSQYDSACESLSRSGLRIEQIAAIGVTNQRETTLLWERDTGRPLSNAIVWQSRITAGLCERLKADGCEQVFRDKTGLVLDPYFSGTKIRYLLDTIPGARRRAECGEVLFGTVDTFLMWRLSGGKLHITDASNASRTLLFNIHACQWDDELLRIMDVPRAILPEVRSSSEVYGETDPRLFGSAIPLAGIAGDQQAATFGQSCLRLGEAKNTYGTGCFLLLCTGDKPVPSRHGLLTTIGWDLRGKITYCLEGSVFVAGAVVQWLRDGLGIIRDASEIEALAKSVPDNGGVYFVPAFVGLGTPYWDPAARGLIIGLTRGTTRGHVARAALEAMAFQTRDVLEAMQRDAQSPLTALKVDGGASSNDFLMQFQSDLLGVPVSRPAVNETTALGAAFLAGLAVGVWDDPSALERIWTLDRQFLPQGTVAERNRRYSRWQAAVARSREWEPMQE